MFTQDTLIREMASIISLLLVKTIHTPLHTHVNVTIYDDQETNKQINEHGRNDVKIVNTQCS